MPAKRPPASKKAEKKTLTPKPIPRNRPVTLADLTPEGQWRHLNPLPWEESLALMGKVYGDKPAESEDPPESSQLDGYPSPFYDLVEVAKLDVDLHFHVRPDGSGPDWNDAGDVISEGRKTDFACVDVHHLGGERYRLLSNDIAGQLCLGWGEEFYATREGDALHMYKVVVPRRFRHFHMIWSGMTNDTPQAKILHEMGGGWERIATGVLTVSVPVEHTEAYFAKLEEQGCELRGVFAREL